MKQPIKVPKNRYGLDYELHVIANEIIADNVDIDVMDFKNLFVPAVVLAMPEAIFDAVQPFDLGKLFFHSQIEDDEIDGLQQDLMRVDLSLPKSLPITLYLSSVGGSVYAGLALISTIQELRRSGRRVHVVITGICMSMATVIAQVADYRSMESSAQFMLHKISYNMRGSADEHEEELQHTNRLHEVMFGIYTARTGKDASYYMNKLKKTNLYLTATEALSEGLVDEILVTKPYAKQADPVLAPPVVKTKSTRKTAVK